MILDLDNTLMGWDAPAISPRMCRWVARVKNRGFLICITSNGLNERVRKVAEQLSVPAIAKATKPRKRPFRQALKLLNAQPEQVAVVGDQVFTDIFGGNRMDCYTILINPISRKELRTTQIVRRVEKRVISRLHKKGLVHDAAFKLRQEGYSHNESCGHDIG